MYHMDFWIKTNRFANSLQNYVRNENLHGVCCHLALQCLPLFARNDIYIYIFLQDVRIIAIKVLRRLQYRKQCAICCHLALQSLPLFAYNDIVFCLFTGRENHCNSGFKKVPGSETRCMGKYRYGSFLKFLGAVCLRIKSGLFSSQLSSCGCSLLP